MSAESKNFLELKKKIKKYDSELIDAFVFGSAVKGKTDFEDIDVCLIFKNKINTEVITELENHFGEKIHISTLSAEDFFRQPHNLAQTMLLEGISIFTGKSIANAYGMNSASLFTYDLVGLSTSRKVSFVQMLKGRRGDKGLVKSLGGRFIASAAFIVPVEKDAEILEVMNLWKIKFRRERLLFLE